MSPELRLIAAPDRTYAALARLPSPIGVVAALRRPLVAAMIAAATAAMLATGRITASLALTTFLSWSVVIAFQIVVALGIIAGPSTRTVGLARALDLFFAGHAPWSLWMLAIAALRPSAGVLVLVVVSMLIPAALTARIVAAFCRQVLELDPRQALARTIAHQTITWIVLLVTFSAAVAVRPRVLEWLQ